MQTAQTAEKHSNDKPGEWNNLFFFNVLRKQKEEATANWKKLLSTNVNSQNMPRFSRIEDRRKNDNESQNTF